MGDASHHKAGRLSVGSLRGLAQGGARSSAFDRRFGAPFALPPSRTGRGCCRSGCFGCPWADAVRARASVRREIAPFGP